MKGQGKKTAATAGFHGSCDQNKKMVTNKIKSRISDITDD